MAVEEVSKTYQATDGNHTVYIEALKNGRANQVVNHTARAGYMQAEASSYWKNFGEPGVSVREGFDRRDYDWFRPESALPILPQDIAAACTTAYERFPIIRSVFDMMADFVTKGMTVVHPRKRAERLGKEWAQRVGMKERSEHISRSLSITGAAIVSRQTAKVPENTLNIFKQTKAADINLRPPVKLPDGEIPIRYIIRDTRALEVIGDELAMYAGPGTIKYGLRIPARIADRVNSPSPADLKAAKDIPAGFFGSLNKGKLIELQPDKTIPLFYKKSDWELFPKPLLYPILRDLQVLEKLRMGDMAALDGATNYVRLWRIGSLDKGIFPDEAVISRLADLLLTNTGGGGKDIIWGPELDFKESTTDLHHFLGQEKYEPTYEAIFQGLGVPRSLSGGKQTGPANNFVSLRTLIERLEYIRNVLIAFWEAELELLRAQFRFREPFKIVFDEPSLSDETGEKRLLIELCDRNLISAELVQERFGAIPEIEKVRLAREDKARQQGKAPPRYTSLSILMPGQGGEGLDEWDTEYLGDETGLPATDPNAQPDIAKKPVRRNGRPQGSKDTVKRVRRNTNGPSKDTPPDGETYATFPLVVEAYRAVEDVVKPLYLQLKNKSNLRQLSTVEAAELEDVIFATLSSMGSQIMTAPPKPEEILEVMKAGPSVPGELAVAYRKGLITLQSISGKTPTVEQERNLKVALISSHLTV